MITRRKFLAGLVTLAAGTIAASQLSVFKQDDGELFVQMHGTNTIDISVPYNCIIRSVTPQDQVLLESNGAAIKPGGLLTKGQTLKVIRTSKSSEVRVGVSKT